MLPGPETTANVPPAGVPARVRVSLTHMSALLDVMDTLGKGLALMDTGLDAYVAAQDTKAALRAAML